jgi:hypothetical protein
MFYMYIKNGECLVSNYWLGKIFLAVFFGKIAGKITSHFNKLFFTRQNSNGIANGHVHQNKNILCVHFVIDTTTKWLFQ